MRKEKKRTEGRGQRTEGERLGRWEGEIKPGQMTEVGGQDNRYKQ